MRLVGGTGTLCDPLFTGTVEIFNAGAWGAVCQLNSLGADVVCRQLGFPHGTVTTDDVSAPIAPKAWLREAVSCRGPEAALLDCNLGVSAFSADLQPCNAIAPGQQVACRRFAVDDALEADVTPGAGALQMHGGCCSTHRLLSASAPTCASAELTWLSPQHLISCTHSRYPILVSQIGPISARVNVPGCMYVCMYV